MLPYIKPGAAIEPIQANKLAFIATTKLECEGRWPDHRSRHLVLTANLIDGGFGLGHNGNGVQLIVKLGLAKEMLKHQLDDKACDQDIQTPDTVADGLAALIAEDETPEDEDVGDESSDQDSSDTESESSDDSEEAITPPPFEDDRVSDRFDRKTFGKETLPSGENRDSAPQSAVKS